MRRDQQRDEGTRRYCGSRIYDRLWVEGSTELTMIVYTGEEGEETVYQCRSKLYVMQADGGWKERGVGALRLNVRSSDGKGPRLGMSSPPTIESILSTPFPYSSLTLRSCFDSDFCNPFVRLSHCPHVTSFWHYGSPMVHSRNDSFWAAC